MSVSRSPDRRINAPGESPPAIVPQKHVNQGDDASTVAAARVPVQIPQFWEDDPSFWFGHVELTLGIYQIRTDKAKFRYAVTYLGKKALSHVRDIVHRPPAESKYEAIKQRVIEAFEKDQESKRRLLHRHEIGDEKPTTFLQRLRNLGSDQCPDSVLRSIFIEQMPENVRAILAASGWRTCSSSP